jgi:hypothetical protein
MADAATAPAADAFALAARFASASFLRCSASFCFLWRASFLSAALCWRMSVSSSAACCFACWAACRAALAC